MTQSALPCPLADEIRKEAEQRRTFAIISHPDAGKTTITEKLLLMGKAIDVAGSVKSRKAGGHQQVGSANPMPRVGQFHRMRPAN